MRFKMENKSPKVLIVGQGIAGSILAWNLYKSGFQVQIFDNPQKYFKSSIAAGGLFNPVTGRKLEQTWLADHLFPFLFAFYPRLEEQLNARFFYPMPLFRPFANEEMKTWLLERKNQIHHAYLEWKEDGVFVNQTGWVDVKQMLEAFEHFFTEKKMLQQKSLDFDKLLFNEEGDAIYEGETYRYIIFCEGFHAQKNNPYFKDLCFLPAKGELFHIETSQANDELIINKNGFLLPLGNQHFKVGATYSWDDLSQNPRPIAIEELHKKVIQFHINNYKVKELLVGIRPATQDRRPFIGFIPGKKVGIFNGFGSKGVSLIPYFANQFTNHLLFGEELNSEVSIHRFSHLFST
ncbi:MAG: hypothetical protein RJA76_77 [Bacteroidota bacterium]